MKILGIGLMVTTFGVLGFGIISNINAEYAWNTNFGSNWELGVKASTIQQKSQYIDKFVAALDSAHLEGQHDSLWYPTPNNGFSENMVALKSLQDRLHTVQGMDESSFQYQTAIQQITAQEQDEAGDMLSVLKGSWYKQNHWVLWMGGLIYCALFAALMFFAGLTLVLE